MENLVQVLDVPFENNSRTLRYAGFWIRVAAAIIDMVVIFAGFSVLAWTLSLLLLNGFSLKPADLNGAESSVIQFVILFYSFLIVGIVAYVSLMESSARQGTLGKMAVGIKVGNANGGKLSFANALGRYFSKYLSTFTLFIGFLMVAWDPKKQGLHDKIANTYVFY